MSPIAKSDLDQISMTIATAMQSGFAQLTAALTQHLRHAKSAAKLLTKDVEIDAA